MVLGDTCPHEAHKGARCPGCGDPARQRRGQQLSSGSRTGCAQLFLRLKMLRLSQRPSLLLLLVLAATARGQAGTGPKVLEPWLLGLTAVVVFLFIVFVVLIINRFWNLRMRRKDSDYPETTGTVRLEDVGHINPAVEDSDEESDGKSQNYPTAL
ncbi:small integral membrane protein 24 isoform X2 [Pithys albifrons albifrons]|uniref:small integral membrane protein 24 isoform X2 n=1 Tax=Pithys albifrons albifrons TaxID=3385563 RepID=UPI003A5CBDD6